MAAVLQQSVHGDYQKATQCAQHNQEGRSNPYVVNEVHADDEQAHANAQRHDQGCLVQLHSHRGHHSTHSGADGNDTHQTRGLRGGVSQSNRAPGQDDVAQVT